jgi:hypothetical protein
MVRHREYQTHYHRNYRQPQNRLRSDAPIPRLEHRPTAAPEPRHYTMARQTLAQHDALANDISIPLAELYINK